MTHAADVADPDNGADPTPADWPDRPVGLVGRAEEFTTIVRYAKSAVDGQPAFLRVEGDAGTGKTALARAAAEQLPGFIMVWIACHDTESAIPFGIADQTVLALRRLAAHRGIPIGRIEVSQRSPIATGRILLSVLDQVQRVRPVVVVLDDAQWCDEQSLATYGVLLRRLRIGRVLLVLTSTRHSHPLASTMNGREGASEADLRRHLRATAMNSATLRLRPLSTDALLHLAGQITGRQPDDQLTDRLVRLSGGNPRIARLLIDGADLDDGSAKPLLPPSLIAAFGEQLGSLPQHAREMLDALAIIGSPARIALVARLAGSTDHIASLECLLERGLVTWSPHELPARVAIADPLVTDAVHQLLGPRRRRDLHAAAAELVPRAQRWAHRTAAAIGVNPALAAELESEATVAIEQSDVDLAVRYLRWAADLSDTKQAHDRAVLTTAVLELWWGRADLDQLDEAIDATEPAPLRDCALGLLRSRQPGRQSEAGDLLRACLHGSAATDGGRLPRWVTLLAAAALAQLELLLGDLTSAQKYARAVLEHDTEAELSVLVRTVRTLTFAVLGRDGTAAAIATLEESEADIRRGGRPGGGQVFDFERASLLLSGGQLSASISCAEVALTVSDHPAGDSVHHGAILVLAEARYQLGDWGQASEAVETALRMIDQGTLPGSAVASVHLRAVTLAAMSGRWKRAEHHIGLIDRATTVSAEHRAMYLAIARATVAKALGDYQRMLAAFGPNLAFVVDGSAYALPWTAEFSWRPLLAEALAEIGDLDLARAEIHRLGQLAAQAEHLRLGHLWLSGRLAERLGDQQRARWFLEQAVAGPSGQDDTPLSRAQSEVAFGLLCRRCGDDREAVLWLGRARQRFARLGAVPFAERCDKALLAASKGPIMQHAKLTDRELQVAELVSENLTNHQVADTLYVSEKTVEYHLGKVFAKLGISSRRQLRDIGPALRAAADGVDRRARRNDKTG